MPAFVRAVQDKVPTFRGMKYAGCVVSEGGDAVAAGRDDQTVFIASGELLSPALMCGIDASMVATYSAWPKLAHDIVNAVQANDIAKAQKLQKQQTAFINTLKSFGAWVPMMKLVTGLTTGIQVGPPRPPLKAIPQAQVEKVTQSLKEQGLWPN